MCVRERVLTFRFVVQELNVGLWMGGQAGQSAGALAWAVITDYHDPLDTVCSPPALLFSSLLFSASFSAFLLCSSIFVCASRPCSLLLSAFFGSSLLLSSYSSPLLLLFTSLLLRPLDKPQRFCYERRLYRGFTLQLRGFTLQHSLKRCLRRGAEGFGPVDRDG